MFIKKHLLKKIFFLVVGIVVIFSIWIKVQYQDSPKKWNILLLSIDTLRPDHMGIYGYTKNTTPNIDKWAKDAYVFTNARTVVPSTYPSFSALLTGLHPLNTLIFNPIVKLSPNSRTLPKLLKENGYYTASFITNHVFNPIRAGFDAGFDEFNYNDDYYDINARDSYESFVRQGNRWLEKSPDKPFFLWAHLMDPHTPYHPRQEFDCTFDTTQCNTIKNTTLETLEKRRRILEDCQKEPITEKEQSLYEALYDGGVATADQLAGEILQTLKRTGLDKNTIVIIYGDHGEGFDHKYYFTHGKVLYDSSIRIPLIIKHPIVQSGKKITNIIDNTDIFPTILSFLGIPNNTSKIDGVSLAPFFSSNQLTEILQPFSRSSMISMNVNRSKYSVADDTYTYIYTNQNRPSSCLYQPEEGELYNIVNDPNQERNIIHESPSVASKLRDELFNRLSRYNLPSYLFDYLLDFQFNSNLPKEILPPP